MKYQLVMKNTGDIITVTDSKVFGLDEAKVYYIRMKQLKEKEFDELYVVEEYIRPEFLRRDTVRNWDEYNWWKEEPKTLDDF